jgi:hypothetical protein
MHHVKKVIKLARSRLAAKGPLETPISAKGREQGHHMGGMP